MKNLAILDLREESEDENYGEPEVIELSEYFEVDEEELLQKWKNIKEIFLSPSFEKSSLSIPYIASHLSKLEITVGEGFPHIKRLINIITALPISNAEVEKTFFQLKLILTDYRNRLKVDTVNKLMMVKINDGNDYLLKAVKKWQSTKVR